MKMKFVLENAAKHSTARLGILSHGESVDKVLLETPLLSLYTKSGTVPHLTHEVLQMVTKDKHLLTLPIGGLVAVENRMKTYKKGINEFIGMKEHLTFVAVQDAMMDKNKSSLHENSKVSVWTRFGRKQLTHEYYLSLINNLKPNIYQFLCDNDTNINSTNKRIHKCYINSKYLLEKCLENVDKLPDSCCIASLIGGYDVGVREEFSKLVGGKESIFGVLVDGLFNSETEGVEEIDGEVVKPAVQASLKHIPKEKLRIMNGPWCPLTVLQLVVLGVDVFDTSYPYKVTERGCALVFPVNVLFTSTAETSETKKMKLDKCCYELDLNDDRMKGEFVAISGECECLTCKHHTRAYINHLLTVKELLGPVLLMIHNLHYYIQFFKTIRSAVKNDEIQFYIKLLSETSTDMCRTVADQGSSQDQS